MMEEGIGLSLLAADQCGGGRQRARGRCKSLSLHFCNAALENMAQYVRGEWPGHNNWYGFAGLAGGACVLCLGSLSALVCLLDFLATPVHWDNCVFNYLICILKLFPCNMKTIP